MAMDEMTEKSDAPAPEQAEGEETATLVGERGGPSWFITLLWYIFVGSWLSALWSLGAWLLSLTLIGLPLGNAMLNRLPRFAALQPLLWTENTDSPPQAFWLWRVAYFVFVGWWLSFVWLSVAWLASLTLLGLPLAIALWNRAPAITTLARY